MVSICNVALSPRPTCLLRVNLLSHRTDWVDIGCADELLASGTGICADDRHIYHVSIAKSDFGTRLSILDRHTLEVRNVQRLLEVIDPHSVEVRADELFVASTGTDQIIGYTLTGAEATSPRVVWTPTDSGSDTQHVNSLAVVDGDLWCSAFGVSGTPANWREANNGYIYNVTRERILLDGLQQPHSASHHDGRVYFCNSRLGTVNSDDTAVAQLAGYSRGLAFGDDGTIYAGTSFGRRAEATTEVFHNPADHGPLHGRCAIVHLPEDDVRVEFSLTGLGLEIYDLLLM